MEKKVVYSLLALSAVSAANAAAAVDKANPVVGMSSEMTAESQEVSAYQIDADDADAITGEEVHQQVQALQGKIDQGVVQIEGYIGMADELLKDSYTDEDEAATTNEKSDRLKELKLLAAAISQELRDADVEAQKPADAEDIDKTNWDKVVYPFGPEDAPTNEYLKDLKAILDEAARIAQELQKIADANAIDKAKDELTDEYNSTKEALDAMNDENSKKEALKKELEDIKDEIDNFDGDPTKEAISEELSELNSKIDAANANYDAYITVKGEVEAKQKDINTANDQLQNLLNSDEKTANGGTYADVYGDLIKKGMQDLAQDGYTVGKIGEENEDAYKEGKAAETQRDLEARLAEVGDPNAIVKDVLDKINACEEAYTEKEAEVEKLEDAVKDIKTEDYPNAEDLGKDLQDIKDDIKALQDKIDEAYADHTIDELDITEDVKAINDAIEALNSDLEAAEKNKEAKDAIDGVIETDLLPYLEKQYNDATTDDKGNDKAYGEDKLDNHYLKFTYQDLLDEIAALETEANDAYKAGTAESFKETELDAKVEAIKAEIDDFVKNVVDAYDHYVELTKGIATLEKDLEALKTTEEQIEDETFKAQADGLTEELGKVQKALEDALGKNGQEHWEALLAISIDDLQADVEEATKVATDALDKQKTKYAEDARNAIQKEVYDRLPGLDELVKQIEEALATTELGGAKEGLENEFKDLKEGEKGVNWAHETFEKYAEYGHDVKDNTEANDGLVEVNKVVKDTLVPALEDLLARIVAVGEALADVKDLANNLQEKLDQLTKEITDYEDGDDDPLLKDLQEKIDEAQDEIDALDAAIKSATDDGTLTEKEENGKTKAENMVASGESIGNDIDQISNDFDGLKAQYEAWKELRDYADKLELPTEGNIETKNGGPATTAAAQEAYNYFVDLLHEALKPFDKTDPKALYNYDNIDYKSVQPKTVEADKEAMNAAAKTAWDVVDLTEANRNAYEDQLEGDDTHDGKYDLQNLWNQVYGEISNLGDDYQLPERKPELLEELQKIQDEEINPLAKDIEDYYGDGTSAQNSEDVFKRIRDIEDKILGVKAKILEGYDEAIAGLNSDLYKQFTDVLDDINKVFKEAIDEISSYRGIKNEELAAAIQEIVNDAHDTFYQEGTDNAYRGQIQTLAKDAWEDYKANFDQDPETEKTTKVWANAQDFIEKAKTLLGAITDDKTAFEEAVKQAVKDFWATKSAELNSLVKEYQDKLDAEPYPYVLTDKGDKQNKTEKNKVYKNVTDVIKEANKYVADPNVENINKLDNLLNTKLNDVEGTLAADLDKAAVKDIDLRFTAADKKKAEWEGVEVPTDNYDAAKALYDEAKANGETLDGDIRNEIIRLLNLYVEEGDALKKDKDEADKAEKELNDAQTALNDAIDKAIESIKDLVKADMDPDSFIEALENLKEKVNKMEDADGKSGIESDINTIVNNAIDADQEYIKSFKDKLEAEYNRIASQKPEIAEGATEEEAYAAEVARAEEAKAIRNRIDAAMKAANDDAITLEDLLKAEEDLANLITELSLQEGTVFVPNDEGTAKEIQKQIDELKGRTELNGEGLEKIDDQFSEDVEDVAAAIAEAEKLLDEYKDHAIFYEPKITAPLTEGAGTMDNIEAAAKELNDLIVANEEAFATAEPALKDILSKIQDAKDVINGYENIDDSTKKVYLDELDEDAGYIEDELEAVEDLAKNNHLVEELDDMGITAEEYAEDVTEDFNRQVADFLNKAAAAEYNAKEKAVKDALAEALKEKDGKQYAAVVAAEIEAAKDAINEELRKINGDESEAFANTELADKLDELLDRLDGVLDSIDALKVKIATSSLGDINGDGKVTASDYLTILDYALGKEEVSAENKTKLDINEDGDVDVVDATAIANLLRFGNVKGEPVATSRSKSAESFTVETIGEGNTMRLAINLDNTRAYVAGQLDIVLPEGMTIVGESLTDRANGHELYSNTLADGTHRIIVAGLEAEAFQGNHGAVAYIDVQVDGDYQGGDVKFTKIVFADAMAQSASFTFGAEATGINGVSTLQNIAGRIYNMGGRMVDAVKKGISIVRGADGSTKKVLTK